MIGDIKNIIVIESLNNDTQTGRKLYDDCIERRIRLFNKDIKHQFWAVQSKSELLATIAYYKFNSAYIVGGLLLHFEMHGDSEKTGLVLSNGELISWPELIHLFREININICNKLFITMATCNGRFLYKGIDPNQKTPFSGFISASKIVSVGEISDKFPILFEHLIESGNLIEAYDELEKTENNFYYKDLRAVFTENIESFSQNPNNGEALKKQIRIDMIKVQKDNGLAIPSEQELEILINQVFRDLVDKQAKNFLFEC